MKHTLLVIEGAHSFPVSCETGQTLAQALQAAGVSQPLPCGGRGTCGKCRVNAEGALEPPDSAELSLLGDMVSRGVRLSCRAKIAGDCSVSLQQQGASQISLGRERRTENNNPFFQKWGVAVDIGTTTLAAQLYNSDGLQGDAAAQNPQGAFGADVMTRIGASLAGQAKALQQAVVHGVESLVRQLARGRGIDISEIDAMVLTGNTTMLYLLTGRSPESLSHAPFEADCLFGEIVNAKELGFSFSAPCYLPRCIAAFVGADITTAMLASGMLEREETALLVDIGTNGEMALWHAGRLTCCATAAGPAFEGAQISCGCHGIAGAVDHVWLEEGAIRHHEIGGASSVGICGSGIIDALAALLKKGAVDETGRLVEPDSELGGGAAIRIADNVSLTQKDVRSVQLAKSAICAGIRTLLHEAGLSPSQLQSFYIAGGFGLFIDLNSAVEIGLFPPELYGAARVIGNAAQTGAAMMLQDRLLPERMAAQLNSAAAIDLSQNPYFINQYVEGMMFGEE